MHIKVFIKILSFLFNAFSFRVILLEFTIEFPYITCYNIFALDNPKYTGLIVLKF